jgi:hypothetical protein
VLVAVFGAMRPIIHHQKMGNPIMQSVFFFLKKKAPLV